MKTKNHAINRRNFIRAATTLTAGAGLSALAPLASAKQGADKAELFVVGPIEGYAPQVGTLVSMLNLEMVSCMRA